MDGLGDVIARIRSYAPDGLDSTGVEPSGHSGDGRGGLEVAPLTLPAPFDAARLADAARRFGVRDTDLEETAWVLARIQERFESPHRAALERRQLVLAGLPRPLALPSPVPADDEPSPLIETEQEVTAGPARPAALAVTPRPMPLLQPIEPSPRIVETDEDVEGVPGEGSFIDGDDDLRVVPNDDLRVVPNDDLRVVPNHDLRVVPNDDLRVVPNDDAAPAAADEAPLPYESVVRSTPARRRRRVSRVAGRLANLAVTTVIVVLFCSQGALGLLPFRASYVLTGSMSPKMPVGSLVIAHQVPASHIRVGDVITFADPAKPGMDETHRVVAIENGEHGGKVFATKGDANNALDPWRIPAKGEVWQRVYSVPRLGYAFGMLHGPAAHLAVTLLPAFLLAGWVLVWVWKPVLNGAAVGADGPDAATD